jgi:hypothetical protein
MRPPNAFAAVIRRWGYFCSLAVRYFATDLSCFAGSPAEQADHKDIGFGRSVL